MDHKFTSNTFFICYKVLATAVIWREEITDRYVHLYSIICITQRMSPLGGNVYGKVKVKGKVVLVHVMKAYRGRGGVAALITLALDGQHEWADNCKMGCRENWSSMPYVMAVYFMVSAMYLLLDSGDYFHWSP